MNDVEVPDEFLIHVPDMEISELKILESKIRKMRRKQFREDLKFTIDNYEYNYAKEDFLRMWKGMAEKYFRHKSNERALELSLENIKNDNKYFYDPYKSYWCSKCDEQKCQCRISFFDPKKIFCWDCFNEKEDIRVDCGIFAYHLFPQ